MKYLISFFLLIVIILLTSSSCCRKHTKKDEGQALDNKIKQLLLTDNYNAILNSEQSWIYKVNRKLITGTTDQYYNEIILIDSLNANNHSILKQLLLNDASYLWNDTTDIKMKATAMISFKGNLDQQIQVNFDSQSNLIAFNSFTGQQKLRANNTLANFINNLTKI